MSKLSTRVKKNIPTFFKVVEYVNSFERIYTPFCYIDGSLVEIYLKQIDDYILITDLGEFHRWLFSSWDDETRNERQQNYIDEIINAHQLTLQNSVLFTRTTNPGLITTNLLSMAQAISHLSVVIRI